MARSSNSIRFGLNPRGLPYDRVVAVAQAAEAAGFQNISFSDRPPENNLEGWTLATAVALQTDRLRVTHSTLNVPFRNPALLSKMATALDHITGGDRVILTLGTGIQENHFTTYGIEFGTPGERVDGLIDAIEIPAGHVGERAVHLLREALQRRGRNRHSTARERHDPDLPRRGTAAHAPPYRTSCRRLDTQRRLAIRPRGLQRAVGHDSRRRRTQRDAIRAPSTGL